MLGYLSHLVLDELYSIGGRRLKHSFGTALKLFGHSAWANLSTYAKLAVLTAIILLEPLGPAPASKLLPGHRHATCLMDRLLPR